MTCLLTFPLMVAVQEMSDRTALATGRGPGELATRKWRGRPARMIIGVLMIALIAANGLNIAADLVAVGSGMSLLHAGPTWLWALLAGATVTGLVIASSFDGVATLFKILCLVLLIPTVHLNTSFVILLVAVLGTTISPYLFFWQSTHRIEDMRDEDLDGNRPVPLDHRKPTRPSASNAAPGWTYWAACCSPTWSCSRSSQSAQPPCTPTAPPTSTALPTPPRHCNRSSAAGPKPCSHSDSSPPACSPPRPGRLWRRGPGRLVGQAVRLLPLPQTCAGLLHPGRRRHPRRNRAGPHPPRPGSTAGDQRLINGLAAAPFLILVLLIACDQKIMGEHADGRLSTIIGWATGAIMGAAAATSIYSTLG